MNPSTRRWILLAMFIVIVPILWFPRAKLSTPPVKSQRQQHQRQRDPSSPSPPPLTPLSPVCKRFNYTRYFRVDSYEEMRQKGKTARPGDMIELAPGRYDAVYPNSEKPDGEGKCRWPRLAKDGTVFNVTGLPNKLITFCGHPTKTIIDGSARIQSGAGIIIANSAYVRVAGFTVMNALRGMDIQQTNYSEIVDVTTNHTYHEGIRMRYWSSNNLIKDCKVMYTGRGYVGNGEGIYVGTASGQTVRCGNPKDETNYNTIQNVIFGPNVTSENLDIKEYTTGGKIINNQFDGADMRGIHASISWVALKGTNYIVSGNVGRGLAVEGGGIRVMKRGPGQASFNTLHNNTCYGLIKESFCIFIDPNAKGNVLGCEGAKKNALFDSSAKSVLTNDNTCAEGRGDDYVDDYDYSEEQKEDDYEGDEDYE